MQRTLSEQELHAIDAYWRAANYLSVGQIYLLDNPLLKEPLKIEHVKPRLCGVHRNFVCGQHIHLVRGGDKGKRGYTEYCCEYREPLRHALSCSA